VCVYQSGSEYTDISYRYGSVNNFHLNMPSASYYGIGVLDFRVQTVVGYFVFSGYANVDPIYEGEGSAFTEFTITLPSPNNPGTSFPDIQYPSGTPPISNTFSPPATSKPNSSQSVPQQTPPQFNMIVVRVFVALCIIVVLIVATAFLVKQRKKLHPYP